MRNLCTKCVVIHKMCKYVTFYTLSFLSPTPSIQYHLLPFSSSYFILTSIQPSNSSHKCYLSHKSECTKDLFSPLPFCQFTTNCATPSHYLHHSSLAIRYFFIFSVATFPLSEVANNSWIYASRKLGMCKGGVLSAFPACPPSGVRGLTK